MLVLSILDFCFGALLLEKVSEKKVARLLGGYGLISDFCTPQKWQLAMRFWRVGGVVIKVEKKILRS